MKHLVLILFFFLISFSIKSQYLFNEKQDTINIDSKSCKLKIENVDFSGRLIFIEKPFYLENLLVELNNGNSAIIEFTGNILKVDDYSRIAIRNAWLFEDNISNVRELYNEQVLLETKIEKSNKVIFKYKSGILYPSQNEWFTQEQAIKFLEKKKADDNKKNREAERILKYDSITALKSFIGTYKVKLVFRNNKNIRNLNSTATIYLTEIGCTLTDFYSFEPTLRFSFDKNEYLKPEKGVFSLTPSKNIYSSGILIINADKKTGAITLMTGSSTETTSFEVSKIY